MKLAWHIAIEKASDWGGLCKRAVVEAARMLPWIDARLPFWGKRTWRGRQMSANDPKRIVASFLFPVPSPAISPDDLRRSPAQPHREYAAEGEEQVTCVGRAPLFECGVLVRDHCCDLAVVDRPGTGRAGPASKNACSPNTTLR